MVKSDAYLKVLQLISIIREDLEDYGAKPLVEGIVELDAYRADNAEEAEFEVEVSAVHNNLITLAATHLDSEVGDAKGKAKSRVSASMAVFLTALRLQVLSNGYDEGFMEEYG